MDELEKDAAKKPYVAPKLIAISLRPEEAVLGNCKIGSASGPGTPNCATLHCHTIGS